MENSTDRDGISHHGRRSGYGAVICLPGGGHSFALSSTFPYHDRLRADLTAWLSELHHPANSIHVACIDNSITDGCGFKAEEAYPTHLQRMLGDGYVVHNLWRGGRTALKYGDQPYWKEAQWTYAKEIPADIVILKFGTNDSKTANRVHVGEFKADMQAMIDTLKASPSHPRIFLCTPLPTMKPSWGISNSVIEETIIPAIRNLTDENGLLVIDLHEAYKPFVGMLRSDGIHPTSEGASKMAEIILLKLQQ